MLQIDTNHVLHLSIEEIIGQRIAVLGISGSGKTNTVAVLAEELLPHLAMTIVDVEGEYFGLKEQHTLLVAGRSAHAEIPLFVENAAAVAEMSIRRGISVILDLFEYDQEEMQAILLAYFERLWTLSTSIRSPYEIIIEESHEFIPQGQRTPLKTVLTRFALRGRKRGVGLILASQRSAKVEKDLLTQANLLFLQNVVHPTDVGVYKDLIPLPAKEVEQARELVPGEAFVVRGKHVDRVHIRKRHTLHAGATPTLEEVPLHLKTIDAALLEELQQITARSLKEGDGDELSRLKKQLKDAETRMVEQQALIQRQEEHIALLSRLRVHSDGSDAKLLPSTLEINHATVQHMYTPAMAVQAVPTAAHRIVESMATTKAIEQSAPMNEAKFVALQKRLQQVPPLERDMLRVLVEQGTSLTAQDIAAWLNKSESVIRNHPPLSLLKLKVVARSRGTHGYLYRATLLDYLRREFPDGDIQQLQARLVHP